MREGGVERCVGQCFKFWNDFSVALRATLFPVVVPVRRFYFFWVYQDFNLLNQFFITFSLPFCFHVQFTEISIYQPSFQFPSFQVTWDFNLPGISIYLGFQFTEFSIYQNFNLPEFQFVILVLLRAVNWNHSEQKL